MFTLGIDYGTNSVRALIVRCKDGKELGSSVVAYPSGHQGVLLDPRDHNVATLDVNGKPLFRRDDGKSLLSYRLVGSLEGSRGQSKHRKREVENIMPSPLFQPTPKTNVLFQWEYHRVDGERGNNIDGFARTVAVPHPNGLTGDVPLSVLFPGVDPHMSWDGPDHKQPEFQNDVLFQVEHRFTKDFVARFAMNNHNRNRRCAKARPSIRKTSPTAARTPPPAPTSSAWRASDSSTTTNAARSGSTASSAAAPRARPTTTRSKSAASAGFSLRDNLSSVDHSDSATFWVLLGHWGVSLKDIPPDGTNHAARERANEQVFKDWSRRIHDELLRRARAAAGIASDGAASAPEKKG